VIPFDVKGDRYGQDEPVATDKPFTSQGDWSTGIKVDPSNPAFIVEGNSPLDAAFTFTNPDTTPSVGAKNTDQFKFSNSSATNVTTFDDGHEGQKLTVIAQNGNTTLVHSESLILQGAVNWNMPAGSTSEFFKDGSSWRQKSRLIV
jgi:hypothetical protein